MTHLSQDEQQRLARLLIASLHENDDLKQRLPSVGMDIPATLAEGQRLYAAADTLISQHSKLQGKVNRMWERLHELHAPAWKTYKQHRTLALAVIETADLQTTMELRDRLSIRRPGQLNQMRPFYREVLDSPEALALLDEVNLTKEKLERGRAAVAEMDTLEEKIAMTEASKQDTTRRQTEALALLDAWRTQAWKRIEIVTEDAPQLRKAVGMKG